MQFLLCICNTSPPTPFQTASWNGVTADCTLHNTNSKIKLGTQKQLEHSLEKMYDKYIQLEEDRCWS